MCGRTTLTITPKDLERTFGFPVPPEYRPRYNIAPTQQLLAIGELNGESGFRNYRWGLVPFWAKDLSIGNRLINARSETVMEKPAFRAAFAKRRCLVVVDGYYEWRIGPTGKRPHRIRSTSGEAFTLAGIWELWGRGGEAIESCTILTTRASSALESIHDRMPVIIGVGEREKWLSAGAAADALIPLLAPYAGDDLNAYEVSTLVNSPANDVEDCVEPVDGPSLFASGIRR